MRELDDSELDLAVGAASFMTLAQFVASNPGLETQPRSVQEAAYQGMINSALAQMNAPHSPDFDSAMPDGGVSASGQLSVHYG